MTDSTIRAQALASSNLLYRDPVMRDHFEVDAATTAAMLTDLVANHGGAGTQTLLDLGCGTGALAGAVADRFEYLGVDIQPWLIDHARRTYPDSRFETGDLLHHRVGRRFDLVVCLGNTLAYLHEPDELAAACSTFAAHTNPGGLLVLGTLVAPPRAGRTEDTVPVPGGCAVVVAEASWDPSTQVATTTRTWRLPDNTTEVDLLVRKVHSLDVLAEALADVGLSTVEAFDRLDLRAQPVAGPHAYLVAQART